MWPYEQGLYAHSGINLISARRPNLVIVKRKKKEKKKKKTKKKKTKKTSQIVDLGRPQSKIKRK